MMRSVFGYGSLVNSATLPAGVGLQRGSITGWVRQWRNPRIVSTGTICGLTVARRHGIVLQGAVFQADSELETSLSIREGEDELVREGVTLLDSGSTLTADLFVTPTSKLVWANDDCPICVSYLDCILQGFLRLYDRLGVENFLDSSEGWHLPLCHDREEPRYPRAIMLDPSERALIDDCLRARRFID